MLGRSSHMTRKTAKAGLCIERPFWCVCVRTCLLHDMCSARLSFYSIIGSVAEHLACNQKHAGGSSPAGGCSRQQSGPTCGQSAGSRGDRGAGQWQNHTKCVHLCVCIYMCCTYSRHCTQVCLNMGSYIMRQAQRPHRVCVCLYHARRCTVHPNSTKQERGVYAASHPRAKHTPSPGPHRFPKALWTNG